MSDIKISVETAGLSGVDGEITTVRVDGVIDTMTAHELEKVINSLLAQRRFKIVVDLGGVDYISSAGWGIFISNIREIRLNNGDIKLARMIPNVYEIFELLEFDSILRAFDNVEKAKADFVVGAADSKIAEQPVAQRSSATTRTPSISVGPAPDSKPATVSLSSSKVTVDEATSHDQPKKEKAFPAQARKLDEAILDLVGKDPFLSVGEIRRELAKDFPGIGFWKVWWTLRRMGLGSKRKRFYYARTRNFGS